MHVLLIDGFTEHSFVAVTVAIIVTAYTHIIYFRSSSSSFGSPVLATSLELILAETKFSSLKTDVMMTADILV